MQVTQLGRYILQSELGRGAMGIVYQAIDSVLERPVAIKTVNVTLEQEHAGKYEARFYQEARAAGGLNHPNIVTVHDVGKSGDMVFMAMEYIEGVELRTLMADGQALGVAQALSIAAQVADGLAYAHKRGVVHRDIKPANIMVVANGPVKITDFGIARMRGARELTQSGVLLGSPKYMSPEQAIGKRADHRSDIFSLGVILYEMLCGAAPFSGENITALMYQIVNFAPPPPSALHPGLPAELDAIVGRMLAKPLEERYQDAAEVARDLRACERSLTAPAAATGARATLPPPQPTLVDAEQASVLAQGLARTRETDQSVRESAPPARRIDAAFDSREATERLAALTGLASASRALPAAAATRPPGAARWRRRDWLVFAAGALGGIAAAGALLRRR